MKAKKMGTARRARTVKAPLPNGAIIYRGPSLLDGAPIVAIVIGLATDSANVKTGAMLQSYILRDDMHPLDAIASGADYSICGDCSARGTAGDGTGRERGRLWPWPDCTHWDLWRSGGRARGRVGCASERVRGLYRVHAPMARDWRRPAASMHGIGR